MQSQTFNKSNSHFISRYVDGWLPRSFENWCPWLDIRGMYSEMEVSYVWRGGNWGMVGFTGEYHVYVVDYITYAKFPPKLVKFSFDNDNYSQIAVHQPTKMHDKYFKNAAQPKL